MKNRIISTVAIAAVCLAAATSCNSGKKTDSAQGKEEKLTGVTIMAATSKDVDQVEIFTGTVEGYNTNNISPQSPGRIERIFVEVGDHVGRGQRLAQMEATNLTQAKLQMENNRMESLASISAYYYADPVLTAFIKEDVAPFYAGDRPVDDVIRIINDRATKYVKEM